METELIKLIGQLGGAGAALFLAVKYGVRAIEGMYNDMKEQQNKQLDINSKREDVLMTLVEENTKANTEIAITLQNLYCSMKDFTKKVEKEM